jgi:alpha-D-ribose 1-methylphosphonate 5-triphosphate synthase subunit PhnH
MNAVHPMSAGFSDTVHQSQQAFRSVLQALSRPGLPLTLGAAIEGVALQPAMAHVLLTLTDDDTPVWWQQPDEQAAQWLRFHTSAPVALMPDQGAFAVITRPQNFPGLDRFLTGSSVSPECSTTLLIEVTSFETGPALQWSGPGLLEPITVCVGGLGAHFWTQWRDNVISFPQGVDVIFCCSDRVMGLPRTTHVKQNSRG